VKPADETRLVTTVSNALRYRRLQDVLAALEQAGRGRAQGAEGPSEDAERPWRQAEGGLPIPVRGGRAAGRGPAVLLEGSLLLSEREREVIEVALQQAAGNRSEALRVLGIGRSTLYRKLKEHGLK
jgi:transcriptional regulator of acetoin/glycerol metabolism